MCQYHYIYFDKCQHVSLYRVSYCDRAKAFGLPRLDSHPPNADSAGDTPGGDSSPAFPHPTASSADKSSSSHSHNQHNRHSMSTLTHSGGGTTFSRNATPTECGDHMPQHVALIPRSALQEHGDLNLESSALLTSSLLDTQHCGNMDLGMPLGHESSFSPVASNDGKATRVVAQLDSHFDSEVSHIDSTRASVYSNVSDTDTVRGPSSPRKSIPSQWLPLSNAPSLATAQRAKERRHKPEPVSDSPTKADSLRGSRSMADMGKTRTAEGSSFLTKNSRSPLESDLTSPTAGKSPTKRPHAASKPAWNSPNGSPLHESPQQQSHLIMRTSPAKTKLLAVEPTLYRHRRGVSSVASTTGDSIYHSAESSPVRETTDLTPSFKSDAEVFDEHEYHIPDAQLRTDDENAQKSKFVHTSVKAATVGRASKPSLRIDIPRVDTRPDAGEKSSSSFVSATSNSSASNSPWSPVTASSTSRIPRAAVPSNASSARGPTRSSTLKRAQSTKSLTSSKPKARVQDHNSQRQSDTTATAHERHVRIGDSSGTTPVLPECPASPRMLPANLASSAAAMHSPSAQKAHTTIEQVASMLRKSTLHQQHDLSRPSGHKHIESPRASSISTVKASDHSAIDPAIVYSKKSATSGTNLVQPLYVPEIIVMMAHNVELDPSQRNEDQLRAASVSSIYGLGSSPYAAPVRGRTEQYVPATRRQVQSEHSLESSLASELRATATEFVPYPSAPSSDPKPSTASDGPESLDISQLDPTTDLLGPVKYELDPYGIPWFYYMYQVQFAFDQGYQKGRSRSPKKTRQKKQYTSGPSPANGRHQKAPAMAPASDAHSEQQRISTMPPPASTVPLAEQRAQQQYDDAVETTENDEQRPYSPFAAQKEMIDRHFPYRNATVIDRPVPGIDLTTIRNVGLPHGTRSMAQNFQSTMHIRDNNYSNARRNHHRSDNGLYTYRGRGAAGLRMADTVPFPAPVAPQGRPAHSNVTGEGCGLVDIIYGAERIGGEACHDCEPDHPLD